MASVTHVEHSDGSQSIGLNIDGVFVPFATLSAVRVHTLIERVHTLQEMADEGNAGAAEVLSSEGLVIPSSSSSAKAKGSGS